MNSRKRRPAHWLPIPFPPFLSTLPLFETFTFHYVQKDVYIRTVQRIRRDTGFIFATICCILMGWSLCDGPPPDLAVSCTLFELNFLGTVGEREMRMKYCIRRTVHYYMYLLLISSQTPDIRCGRMGGYNLWKSVGIEVS